MPRFSDPPTTAYARFWQRCLEPAMEKARGKTTAQAAGIMEQSQWWSRDQLDEWQWRELARLLDWAREQVPFYRRWFAESGLSPEKIVQDRDLALLPLMDRDLVSRDPGQFRAARMPAGSYQKNTGGTTGQPLRLMLNPESEHWRTAATRRGYGWAGASNGNRQLHVWSADIVPLPRPAFLKRAIHRSLMRQRFISYMHMLSGQDADKVLQAIDDFQPISIVSYASAAEIFCRRALQKGWRPKTPPYGLITGAETVFPHQREIIEQALGCKVFETYGSREFMLIGCECPAHEGMHLSEENLMLEILADGRPAQPGELGELVITDLHNFSQPFIRYRIGDLGSWHGGDACACGRALRRINQVEGRVVDMIEAPDGRRLTGFFFPHLLKDFSAIDRYQIVQTAPERLVIRLKLFGPLPERDQAAILASFREYLPGVEPELKIVDEVETTPSGKIRGVIGLEAYRKSQAAKNI